MSAVKALGALARAGLRRSKPTRMFDPADIAQRAFVDDYAGAVSPGKLTHDIEGRPINPDAAVAGRRVAGGPDESLSKEEVDKLVMQIVGRRPHQVELLPPVADFGVCRLVLGRACHQGVDGHG